MLALNCGMYQANWAFDAFGNQSDEGYIFWTARRNPINDFRVRHIFGRNTASRPANYSAAQYKCGSSRLRRHEPAQLTAPRSLHQRFGRAGFRSSARKGKRMIYRRSGRPTWYQGTTRAKVGSGMKRAKPFISNLRKATTSTQRNPAQQGRWE